MCVRVCTASLDTSTFVSLSPLRYKVVPVKLTHTRRLSPYCSPPTSLLLLLQDNVNMRMEVGSASMDVRSLPIYKPVMSETEAASADGALKDLYKAVDKAHKALVMSPWGIVPDSEEATNLKKIGYPGPWTDKGSDMAKDLAKIGVLGPWETWGKKWEDIKSKTTAAIDKEADALKKQGLFGGDKEQAKDLIKAGLIPGPWGGKGWGGYGGLEKMGFPGPFGKVRSGGCCRCYTCMVIDT